MTGAALRSQAWLAGDDEVALEHRVALASAGLPVSQSADRPVIGIANSASDLNPCNLPLRDLAVEVKAGIEEAGGIGAEFGTISLGEDLMKPSAMLYRNLLAIEIEEMVRANPLDGLVVLANCDKSVPGALMGAISANIPTVLVTGGSRPVAQFRGQPVGTGTALWRMWDERRAGRLDDAGWAEFERCLSCGRGACNTMGTASTMAVLAEVLGLMVPGAASIPSGEKRGLAAARTAGQLAVSAVLAGLRPQSILTQDSFANAIIALHAIGGSTNAVIHLAAMAGRAGLPFPLEDISRLGATVPVLADIEPSGSGLMPDFDEAGGVPALLRELAGLVRTWALTVTGRTIGEELADAPAATGAIRPASAPLREGGAFGVVRGSLAPDGAVVKTSAATPELLRHRGPAVVFRGYDDMLARIDDPALPITPETVLVLTGCGPVGVPGMPEWGMIPIPARLVRAGVTDMVRVTDARMSGTSFGTVVLHVAPEGAVGGPLALVRDGDVIALDVPAGTIDLDVSAAELEHRRASWTPPPPAHLRGWPALYAAHVLQAPDGCDLDFLRAPTPEHRRFVEPIVGRS
ncbi:MAG TPA: dihydroxy-acid dehydratase [Streptosporangiaceae bacterium]|nr:dihydroxy-acid dehydratase [Streptosporangiaceae bacterium]